MATGGAAGAAAAGGDPARAPGSVEDMMSGLDDIIRNSGLFAESGGEWEEFTADAEEGQFGPQGSPRVEARPRTGNLRGTSSKGAGGEEEIPTWARLLLQEQQGQIQKQQEQIQKLMAIVVAGIGGPRTGAAGGGGGDPWPHEVSKLVLSDFPADREQIRKWLFKAEAKIIACSGEPERSAAWVKAATDGTRFENLITLDTDALRRLDVKVFVCMLDAVKLPAHGKHLEQVQLRVRNYHGRQALHVVWFGVMQDLRRDADQALAEIRIMDQVSIEVLDERLTRFQVLRKRVPEYSAYSSMDVLRRLGGGSVEGQVALYGADQAGEPTEEVVENVITALRKICVNKEAAKRWQEAQKTLGKGPAASHAAAAKKYGGKDGPPEGGAPDDGGKGGQRFDGSCWHCEVYGHKQQDCFYISVPKEQIAAKKAEKARAKAIGKGAPTTGAAPGQQAPEQKQTAEQQQTANVAAAAPSSGSEELLTKAFLHYLIGNSGAVHVAGFKEFLSRWVDVEESKAASAEHAGADENQYKIGGTLRGSADEGFGGCGSAGESPGIEVGGETRRAEVCGAAAGTEAPSTHHSEVGGETSPVEVCETAAGWAAPSAQDRPQRRKPESEHRPCGSPDEGMHDTMINELNKRPQQRKPESENCPDGSPDQGTVGKQQYEFEKGDGAVEGLRPIEVVGEPEGLSPPHRAG